MFLVLKSHRNAAHASNSHVQCDSSKFFLAISLLQRLESFLTQQQVYFDPGAILRKSAGFVFVFTREHSWQVRSDRSASLWQGQACSRHAEWQRLWMVCMQCQPGWQARPTCCSGILSFRADFKSLAVLRPRDVFAKHEPKDVPESALRLLKSDNPLILPTTPEKTGVTDLPRSCNCNARSILAPRLLASGVSQTETVAFTDNQ